MASSSLALKCESVIARATRGRMNSSSSRPSTSNSANVSSRSSKYFAGVMLWYTSTMGSWRERRNAATIGSPIDALYTNTPCEPHAR